MDVRCDRCQTEYELEDDSVAERGASVQCTTCGHTFVVSRASSSAGGVGVGVGVGRKAAITPTPGPTTEMAAPAWLLSTEEGKTHRFRDPTTLQKWIVERRVGRGDRVTPPGASARRLGDMDELRPFFDLVDQADRAAAARGGRPTQPETPQRMSAGRGYASPDEDDDDVLMSGRQSRGGQRGRGGYSGRLDSDIAAGLSGMGVDDSIGVVLPRRRTGLKVAAGLAFVGLLAGVWYLGSKSGSSKSVATAPAAGPSPPAAVPPAAAPPPPAAAPAAVPPPVAAAPAGEQLGTPVAPPAAAPPAPPAAAPPAPVAAPRAAPPEDIPPEPLPTARSQARGAAAPGGGGMPRGYEQLVAEADRALENGNTAKAQKYVDEALRLQPSGVAAVTSSAYLLLDKHKPLAAVGEFKRALNISPNFSQALFGLGEAYRAAGDAAQAVDAYKKYLAASPAGADAPAARRQIRELESQPARPSHSATAPAPAPGSAPPPMPEPTPPP